MWWEYDNNFLNHILAGVCGGSMTGGSMWRSMTGESMTTTFEITYWWEYVVGV